MTENETFTSAWDAIADTPEQAANLRARAELMQQIAAIINANNWKLMLQHIAVSLSRVLMICCAAEFQDFHWMPW